ncbi:MAG: flippase-like domain-containing protein [Prevotella sp.]|nr:flippase-like domain-containing protein [Prevotella sp.]
MQKNVINNIVKVGLSLLLGGVILYWMYRDFDFQSVEHVLLHEMNWTWMLLSFPFGILAQVFRGWRWRQTLEPLGEHPKTSTSIYSIFISYAISLVIPRIGEFARCGVLRRYEGVSFPKAIGTVVTERAIDSMLVLAITGVAFITQLRIFDIFFIKTGTNIDTILHRFSSTGYIVTVICGLAIVVLAYLLMKKLKIFNKVRNTFAGIMQGITSLKKVRNVPLFITFTLLIWVSYFLHYYLTFFCFEATSHLGIACAFVTFIVGSIAVVVPTPNGAGPWHFAVKTMLILYGLADTDALYFVLIVHSVQTLLVASLGIYAWIALAVRKNK